MNAEFVLDLIILCLYNIEVYCRVNLLSVDKRHLGRAGETARCSPTGYASTISCRWKDVVYTYIVRCLILLI